MRERAASPVGSRALAASALALFASCASFDQDIFLPPFYTHVSRAGGGTEVEMFAGAMRVRTETPGGRVSSWALRPLVSSIRGENGDYLARFLVPLGKSSEKGEEQVVQLLPIFRYQESEDFKGNLIYTFFMLPGIVFQQNPEGKIRRAVFPIAGYFEDFLTFDSVEFFVFPLWLKTVREGRTSYSVLWPIFNYTVDDGGVSTRVFPLYAHNEHAGHYNRWFFLWPIFHYQENDLALPERLHEKQWAVWPLIQYKTRATFEAWSFLWPFFGYSRDRATGFWAWDGPWPLIRLHGGGEAPPSEDRTRFWPFYSHYKGDGQETDTYLWPIFRLVHEDYPDGVRDGDYMIPFWQHWVRQNVDGSRASWQKLWPLYQDYKDPWGGRFAFPALNPLWHMPEIDDTYAWIYEFWSTETTGVARSDRLWGGLYKSERDATEVRSYFLPGVWARRRYVERGEIVEEHSTLFGLLRWQIREQGGGHMLAPAFPGPGFPLERSKEFLPPAELWDT